MQRMRFIITGGSGFVGKFLIEELSIKYPKIEIHNLDIKTNNMKLNNLTNHLIDITNLDALMAFDFNDEDVVFHLAAHIFHPETPNRFNRKSYFENLNVSGTKNLLKSMKKKNVKRIAFLSTCMVYGMPQNKIMTEMHPLNPNGPYGISKVKAEKLILKFAKKNTHKAIIFRPGLIAGPGRYGLLEKLSFLVKYNLPVPLVGNGNNRYQFISVYDCVDALIKFVDLEFPEGVYNLGSVNPPRVKELLKFLIDSNNSKSFLIPTWGWLVKKILNILDIINLTLMYPEQFLLADSEFVLDLTDLKNDLGLQPKFSDKDILIETHNSYLENN